MALLKFFNEEGHWIALYANAIRNRARRDKNLSDLDNLDAARATLGLMLPVMPAVVGDPVTAYIPNENVSNHYHDSRYVPMINEERKARIAQDSDLQIQCERIWRQLEVLETAIETKYNNMKSYVDDMIDDLNSEITGRLNNYQQTQEEYNNALDILPIGTILPYSGLRTDIPDGWYVCDGQNGTPDLSNYILEGTTTDPTNEIDEQTLQPRGMGGFRTSQLPDIIGLLPTIGFTREWKINESARSKYTGDINFDTAFSQTLGKEVAYTRYNEESGNEEDVHLNNAIKTAECTDEIAIKTGNGSSWDARVLEFRASNSHNIYHKHCHKVQPDTYLVFFIMKMRSKSI